MKQKTYLRWGVTITAAACAILVFYDTFFQDGVLFIFIEKLFGILKPVLYGLAMAYLLTPIVDFFDRLLRDRLGAKRAGLMRCLSILVTWLLALGLVYLLFSILIPELVASVSLLFSNLESYYRTIYTWVTQLVEDNPYISERVLTLVRDYYNELVDWVKNTVIPGAQVAIVAVTGGVLSVLVFAKDLLVGIVVSVYILARKETFGLHTRKLLYSLVSAPHYERALRATREADRIFSGFVRGKLLDSLIIGILTFGLMTVLDVSPYNMLIATFVGVTNIIPVFGPFIGAIPSFFIVLISNPSKALLFIILIIVIQQLDGNVIGPKILGDNTGVSSLTVIIAITLCGSLWGVVGMLIGVPLFAVIIEMVRRWLEARLAAKGEPTDTLYYYPKNALSNAERDLYYEHAGIRYRYEHSKLKTRVDKLLARFSGKSKTPPAGADTEDTKKDNRGNTEENGQDS